MSQYLKEMKQQEESGEIGLPYPQFSISGNLNVHSRLHDKRVPVELRYPCVKPADVVKHGRDERDEKERRKLIHAPPG